MVAHKPGRTSRLSIAACGLSFRRKRYNTCGAGGADAGGVVSWRVTRTQRLHTPDKCLEYPVGPPLSSVKARVPLMVALARGAGGAGVNDARGLRCCLRKRVVVRSPAMPGCRRRFRGGASVVSCRCAPACDPASRRPPSARKRLATLQDRSPFAGSDPGGAAATARPVSARVARAAPWDSRRS